MAEFDSSASLADVAKVTAVSGDVDRGEEDMTDLNEEVLECCRYGEAEDLRPLLAYGADVNFCDDNKNTGLHKAAANGHVSCMAVLKEFGAKTLRNSQGNLPIHWAVQNKQKEAFEYLLQNFECDCLEKNDFGKSTLTEAFLTEESDLIALCLNHKSTADDKLISPSMSGEAAGDGEGGDEDGGAAGGGGGGGGEDDESSSEAHAVFHDMNFGNSSLASPPLRVRELPISRADNPFGGESTPEDDTTGLGIWPASILTARWAIHHKSMFEGKVALELGAGCGLPALAVAKYCKPHMVYMTDIHSPTLKNAVVNARLNGTSTSKYDMDASINAVSESRATVPHENCILEEVECDGSLIRVAYLSWLDTNTFPTGETDVVFGSDLVYDINIVAPLTFAVSKILKIGGSFLYAAPDENRQGMECIEVAFKEANLVLVEKLACPDSFYENPLVGEGNSDNYVLHFYDLPAKKPFSLYRFVKEGEA